MGFILFAAALVAVFYFVIYRRKPEVREAMSKWWAALPLALAAIADFWKELMGLFA